MSLIQHQGTVKLRRTATTGIWSPRYYGHFFWLPGKTATHFLVKKKTSLIRPKFFGQIGDRINGVPLYTNIYGYELTQLVCQTKDSNIMTLIVKNDHWNRLWLHCVYSWNNARYTLVERPLYLHWSTQTVHSLLFFRKIVKDRALTGWYGCHLRCWSKVATRNEKRSMSTILRKNRAVL